MKIYYSSKFAKEYKRLPQKTKLAAEKKEKIFRKNPFDPKLKTHKLSGKLKKHWSFTVRGQYRVVFVFEKNDAIFLDIGSHDVYK